MRLVRYKDNPLSLFDDLHQEIDKLFNVSAGKLPAIEQEVLAPRLDISEDEKNVYVEADLPGFDQKDISVKIKGGTLIISAAKEKTEEKKKRNFYRCERFQGNFYRVLALPKNINAGGIKAEHKKGVLHVTLPKKEEEKEVDVDVK
ncbi:MAG: Hsp20/alpha crystallin family protein [Candidatus Omnitrophica bacterium]|nr:Hsp20/alpha crystallin family protein [Candidatus Omnitrophota bacterium]